MCKKNNKPSYHCKNCGLKLNRKALICPKCGGDKKLVKINVEGKLQFRSSIRARKFISAIRSWIKEVISGWFSSGDTQKHPKGVYKNRVVDKEHYKNKDSYQEKIIDVETGKITRDIKEPLEQHRHK